MGSEPATDFRNTIIGAITVIVFVLVMIGVGVFLWLYA